MAHGLAETLYLLAVTAKWATQDLFMLAHHALFTFGICVILYFGGPIFTMTYLTLLADMSNTCNHIRVAISSFDC